MLSVTRNPRYLFFGPLTALVWSALGFHPIVFVPGEDSGWERGRERTTLDWLRKLERERLLTVVRVPCPPKDEVFISQMVRLYGGGLPFLHNESWLVTNDIDMWPMWRDPYVMGKRDGRALSSNAACCGKFEYRGAHFQELPMGAVGMRAKQWRQVMRLSEPFSNVDCLVSVMRKRAEHMFGGTLTDFRGAHWRDDQHMLSVLTFTTPNVVSNMLFVGRSPGDRLDRIDWPKPSCLAQMGRQATDAHLPFPGDQYWKRGLRYLFQSVVTNATLQGHGDDFASAYQ